MLAIDLCLHIMYVFIMYFKLLIYAFVVKCKPIFQELEYIFQQTKIDTFYFLLGLNGVSRI